jgi:hypothetical protein
MLNQMFFRWGGGWFAGRRVDQKLIRNVPP